MALTSRQAEHIEKIKDAGKERRGVNEKAGPDL
jgi:hypothetical protein